MSTREAFEKWFFNTHGYSYSSMEGQHLIRANAIKTGWQACQAHNDTVIAELVEALDMLLITKEYKDKQGKDAVYETMRQSAWANAENVSARHKGQS